MRQHSEIDEYLQQELNKFEYLCHDVFIVSESGKQLWECIKERHLLANKVDPSKTNAFEVSMFDAGFREAFLGLYRFAQNHQAKQLLKKEAV